MNASSASVPLLELRGISKHFHLGRRGFLRQSTNSIQAVDNVSLTVYPGENFGIVGESGCGKSTLARLVLRLLRPTSGEVWFEGRNITSARGGELHQVRKNMQLIFQDPYGSLNPRMRVGKIIEEPMRIYRVDHKQGLHERVGRLLEVVGLSPEHKRSYPNELSGGQRQRVGIARALALNPKIVVCDEPLSSVDVSIRAQIIELLEDLQQRFGLTYIFISHDLSVVRHICDRIAVMYLGRIVEIGSNKQIFAAPHHPYTEALLSAIPVADPRRERKRQRIILAGEAPDPASPPAGCYFHPRCKIAQERCTEEYPPTFEVSDGHDVGCFFAAPFPATGRGTSQLPGEIHQRAGEDPND